MIRPKVLERRRTARQMLRRGIARDVVDRYLAGCRLMDVLRRIPGRLDYVPRNPFDEVLARWYQPTIFEILTRRSPLLDLMAGIKPRIGVWR